MQKHFFPRNRHLLLIMFVGISASQPYIPLDVLSCLSFYCLKVGGLSIAVREGEFPVQLGKEISNPLISSLRQMDLYSQHAMVLPREVFMILLVSSKQS